MVRLLPILALTLWTPSGALPLDGEPPRPPEMDCVQGRTEVRATFPGYTHIVVLSNRCDAAFRCVVTTSASSSSVTADVPAHRHVHVVTSQGSPSSKFTFETTCSPIPAHS